MQGAAVLGDEFLCPTALAPHAAGHPERKLSIPQRAQHPGLGAVAQSLLFRSRADVLQDVVPTTKALPRPAALSVQLGGIVDRLVVAGAARRVAGRVVRQDQLRTHRYDMIAQKEL